MFALEQKAASTSIGRERPFLEGAGTTLWLFVVASQVRLLPELWLFLLHCISVQSASDLRPTFEGTALKQTWSFASRDNSRSCSTVSYWFLGENWQKTMQVFLVPEADFALNRLDCLGSYVERNSKQRGSKHHNPKHLPVALLKITVLSLPFSIHMSWHAFLGQVLAHLLINSICPYSCSELHGTGELSCLYQVSGLRMRLCAKIRGYGTCHRYQICPEKWSEPLSLLT